MEMKISSGEVAVLETLAKDDRWDVRWGVAKNPQAPAAVLETLAKDDRWGVRRGVAKNLANREELPA